MEKISWSPKVRASKIRQLYENDARGTVDEVLVEDVGLTLLQRCQSIWLVSRREVECALRSNIHPLRTGLVENAIRCAGLSHAGLWLGNDCRVLACLLETP